MQEQLAGVAGGGLVEQLVSVAGALLVLTAYAALQRGTLTRESRAFNAMNFVGSALLTTVAVAHRQWGFILLEGAWALLSVPGMVRGRA
jgi:hypothetical protein